MPSKDYYLVLGVARTETTAGIRAAYRALAKRLHPDHVGAQATPAFQEINEAYRVLSDPAQRRLHNHDLQRAEERTAPRPPPWRPAEPRMSGRDSALSILSDRAGFRSSFEALHDHLFRSFSAVGLRSAERIEALHMELMLTAEEARQGLVLPVRVPALRACMVCGGSGRQWAFLCLHCEGHGTVEDEVALALQIPAGVRTGSVLEILITDPDIRSLVLCLHVAVTGARDNITIG
jgi:molecular chaperone DnaJ